MKSKQTLRSTFETFIPDEEAMLLLGKQVASAVNSGIIIFLHGELGTGKTTFVRGFLRGLGYTQKVKSPTYTIVEPYEIKKCKVPMLVFHFDLYRINDDSEFEHLGIPEYFFPSALCLIEWAEKGAHVLPQADLACYIDFSKKGRMVRIQSFTERGQEVLKRS